MAKKFKVVLSGLTALILCVAMVACNNTAPAATTEPTEQATQAPATQEAATVAPQETEAVEATESPASTGEELKASKTYKIATVVKLMGISWYDRLEKGLEQFASDYNVETRMVGPDKADTAQQVKIVEDLIAEKVDAICIVPLSQEALEPVLKKAREAGIVVISHEAAGQENVDFDVEAFNNEKYGAHLMEKIGELTGGQGEYAQFVGTLGATSHNEWCDAGEALQKEKYPQMTLVTDRLEDNDDQKTAYDKARELLTKYPNLAAIQSSSMSGTAGIALAIDEMQLQDKVSLIGTCLVSVAGQYVESGAADMISFWDPADAGYVMNKLALLCLEGQKDKVVTGYDLGVDGYSNLTVDGTVVVGEAWLDADKSNMSQYDF